MLPLDPGWLYQRHQAFLNQKNLLCTKGQYLLKQQEMLKDSGKCLKYIAFLLETLIELRIHDEQYKGKQVVGFSFSG